MKNVAIILAGGKGTRLGLDRPKQFLKIAGKTILEHTVEVFQKNRNIHEIAIVMSESYIVETEELILKNKWSKVRHVLLGGEERFQSSLSAITAYEKAAAVEDINLVFHDAARPLVTNHIIDNTIDALKTYEAVDVAIPAVDTIIEVEKDKPFIQCIPDRSLLRQGQTPQGFRYDTIRKAYALALADPDFKATDDCGVVLTYLPDTKIYVVEGEVRNTKLTHPVDIHLLDKLFQIKTAYLDKDSSLQDLKDKVMVVFGGNSGIGLDMCSKAKALGAHAYVFSRSLNGVDITSLEKVKDALHSVAQKHGNIDYIVNSAAILMKAPLLTLSVEEINQIIATNYKGVVNISLAAYPYLKESKGSLLHFTSSSYTKGRAFYALYSSTKAGVVNFVQALAEEWECDDIRINCINPERTNTPMRRSNFGMEPATTLLSSAYVAEQSLRVLRSDLSGEVIDIKLSDDNHSIK